jgi:hypothetical protein
VDIDDKAADIDGRKLIFESNRAMARLAAAIQVRREVLRSPVTHEELIAEMVEPLAEDSDADHAIDKAVLDKTYAFAQAKLRTAVPKISMDIIHDLWVKPDQAISRLARCEGCGCPGSLLVVGSIWAYNMCPLGV